MLLTETIKNCTSAINKRRAIIESKQHAETYAKALAQLSQSTKHIKNSIDCATAIKENGIVQTPLIDEDTRSELLACIDDCGNGVAEMSLTMETVRLLKAQGDSLVMHIKMKWQDGAREYSDGPKNYLSIIGSLTSNPKLAKDLADRIDRTVSGNPSIMAVNNLLSDVAEAKQITDQFSLKPEIEDFLKKVSSQQASVLDLTPDIIAWLKEKNLRQKLKIRF